MFDILLLLWLYTSSITWCMVHLFTINKKHAFSEPYWYLDSKALTIKENQLDLFNQIDTKKNCININSESRDYSLQSVSIIVLGELMHS